MNARNLITLALPLVSTLWLAAPDASASDRSRLDLLAAAGSTQAKSVHDRGRHGHGSAHDHRRQNANHGGRHGHRGGRGHHGGDAYRDHRGYGYGHGHAFRERAHRYATTAVRQAREARGLGYYSDHPRWRVGYDRHYQWALQARPHRIDEEIRRRARKLRELRSWGHGWSDHRHTPYCRH